jgi:hypothetical protein
MEDGYNPNHPIVSLSTGVILKTLHRALSTLDLPPSTFIQLQKATILNTCHIVRKFFNIT